MIIDKSLTVCLTGHRPSKLPWRYDETKENCKRFKNDLRVVLESAITYGLKRFFTGMAEGFDMIATEILLELKNIYKDIRITAVIPCLGQEKKWTKSQQEKFNEILKNCDDTIIISKIYTKSCMKDRNQFMVNHSSVVIACYNGLPSGTENTIRFAKAKGSKIKIINPDNYK